MAFTVGNITEEALLQIAEKWKTLACSHAPIDRERVKESIKKHCQVVKRTPPEHFVFLESPLTGAIAAAILAKGTAGRIKVNGADHECLVRKFNETLAINVWSMIDKRTSKDWWLRAESTLRKQIYSSYGNSASALISAFTFSLSTADDPVGLRSTFAAKTGGLLSYISMVMRSSVPEKYLDALIETTSKGLTRSLVSSAVMQSWRCSWGCQDPSVPFYDFFRHSGFEMPELDGIISIAEQCGWWWPIGDVCVITERPRLLKVDNDGQLHAASGRAFEYADTWGGYCWHGTIVPKRFIKFTSNMNAGDIINEENLELRRRMLEIYGLENFILASGAQPIQADECGTLYRMELSGDEPLAMVAVVNSTPEPDGHYKRYFLRVPPAMQTAQQAVAWTFGMAAAGYSPNKQT